MSVYRPLRLIWRHVPEPNFLDQVTGLLVRWLAGTNPQDLFRIPAVLTRVRPACLAAYPF